MYVCVHNYIKIIYISYVMIVEIIYALYKLCSIILNNYRYHSHCKLIHPLFTHY